MKMQPNHGEMYYQIDVLHILKSLWKRIWLILICGALAGAIGFSVASFGIEPKYSSYVKLYVNNSSFSLGNTNFSISESELTAAQSLVRTYGEILDSRSTLERIIEKTGVDYSWKELSSMISYAPANDTEIMRVTVTGGDPYEASDIANTIAEVLPVRLAEIIDGASMEVVDSAIPETKKVSPSISNYTKIGFLLGAFVAAAFVVAATLFDETIHDAEYVLNRYGYPILGKIPNLINLSGNNFYSRYSSYGYGQFNEDSAE